MINRVLIRIKVVQMLYSYLLTQGEFKLREIPENATRDKKFAHSTYIDLLLMVLRLSGVRLNPESKVIAGVDDNRYLPLNKVVKSLRSDDAIRRVAMKSDLESRYDRELLAELHAEITRSAIYRSYIRLKNRQLADDVRLWTTIIETIFAKNPALLAAARKSDQFSAKGFEDALAMTAETIAEVGDISGMYHNAKQSLQRSLDKAYDLYHALLALPVEITRAEDLRLDNARNKFLATSEDLNPDTRFIDNELVRRLADSEELEEYFKAHPFSWADDPILVNKLLSQITSSQLYADYMALEKTDIKTDCEFWRNVFRTIILPSDDLAEALENMSVYWNDDLDIVGTFVMKTMRRVAENEPGSRVFLPQFKDEEDAAFGGELFVDTADNFELYRGYIDQFIDRRLWDTERLAFMDVVIMATAISELLNYPAIPIAVTLNEYIEIANCYSTPKSGQFVNGILYSVINFLKSEGKLNKN